MARATEPGTVEIERRAECDLIHLRGEHDMATRGEVWAAVSKAIEADRGVVMSLSDADFIDSGVVNVIYKGDLLLRERNRRLVVHVHTASVVRRTLEVTSVCDALPCCGDVEEAILRASIRGSDSSWSTA